MTARQLRTPMDEIVSMSREIPAAPLESDPGNDKHMRFYPDQLW
ncbi:hypothetical protein [Mesorhizobium amorphae]